MTTVEALVQAYYGRSDLLERIEARLRKAGVDPQKPGFRDLHPFDQLHGLGILATEEHAARASVRAGMQVLDLGSGLGGSSRYLAAVCGCRVSAIDLTPEFVELARVLTARCGLADSIDYRQASALALPFEDASFDHVWCHNVTMNIADRVTLAREVARVLRRQGRFSCVETFFFSVETISTIGYGQMSPATLYGNIVMTVEAMFGLILLAASAGLVLARFTRPTARVIFSKVA